jgi:electron transfer flavoprotein alpha subunit
MTILLLADHDNASLSDQTAKALTAAAKIAKEQASDIHILVAGKAAKAAAEEPAAPAAPAKKAAPKQTAKSTEAAKSGSSTAPAGGKQGGTTSTGRTIRTTF